MQKTSFLIDRVVRWFVCGFLILTVFIVGISLFDSDTVIVSGKVPYYRGKWFNKKQGDFTLVGAGFKSIMEKYVNCKFYVYENSETILYEKI